MSNQSVVLILLFSFVCHTAALPVHTHTMTIDTSLSVEDDTKLRINDPLSDHMDILHTKLRTKLRSSAEEDIASEWDEWMILDPGGGHTAHNLPHDLKYEAGEAFVEDVPAEFNIRPHPVKTVGNVDAM